MKGYSIKFTALVTTPLQDEYTSKIAETGEVTVESEEDAWRRMSLKVN